MFPLMTQTNSHAMKWTEIVQTLVDPLEGDVYSEFMQISRFLH